MIDYITIVLVIIVLVIIIDNVVILFDDGVRVTRPLSSVRKRVGVHIVQYTY